VIRSCRLRVAGVRHAGRPLRPAGHAQAGPCRWGTLPAAARLAGCRASADQAALLSCSCTTHLSVSGCNAWAAYACWMTDRCWTPCALACCACATGSSGSCTGRSQAPGTAFHFRWCAGRATRSHSTSSPLTWRRSATRQAAASVPRPLVAEQAAGGIGRAGRRAHRSSKDHTCFWCAAEAGVVRYWATI